MYREAVRSAVAQVQKLGGNQALELGNDNKQALEAFSANGSSDPNGNLAKAFEEKACERLRITGRSIYATLQASLLAASLTPDEMKELQLAAEDELGRIAATYHGAMDTHGLDCANGGPVDALLNTEILKLGQLFKRS